MKRIMNFTTSHFDLSRYTDNKDLESFYRKFGLDGLELMEAGNDELGIVKADDVIGIHLKYYNYWVCVWNGDTDAILYEYNTIETCNRIFGGSSKEVIIDAYNKNLDFAKLYNPKYAVLHVSDVAIRESITRNFSYTDDQVITAVIELVNEVFGKTDIGFKLLFENLWWPGMTMEKPEIVDRLLSGIDYPNCGVMLDTGHLLHTNTSLNSLNEGVDYIHRILDLYPDLDFVKGIHLHQSLSGKYIESVLNNPFTVPDDYDEKHLAIMSHIFNIDTHKPFVSERISDLVDRINPEYLVFELMSSNREEHESYLTSQINCFG